MILEELAKQIKILVGENRYSLRKEDYTIRVYHEMLSITGEVIFHGKFKDRKIQKFRYSVEEGRVKWINEKKD